MNEHILEVLDEEIARLRQVRAILTDNKIPVARKTRTVRAVRVEKVRRKLSPKARRAIADAQHKRWAKVHRMQREAAAG